jgi:hypothetical protein
MKQRSILAVAAAAIIVAVFLIPRSLRMPASFIEASLLKMTPVGSTSDEVLHRLQGKGFHPTLVSTGFFKQEKLAKPEVVGTSSIRVLIGEYRIRFTTSVSAFWGFDKTGKLIDVWVWKTVDAP